MPWASTRDPAGPWLTSLQRTMTLDIVQPESLCRHRSERDGQRVSDARPGPDRIRDRARVVGRGVAGGVNALGTFVRPSPSVTIVLLSLSATPRASARPFGCARCV